MGRMRCLSVEQRNETRWAAPPRRAPFHSAEDHSMRCDPAHLGCVCFPPRQCAGAHCVADVVVVAGMLGWICALCEWLRELGVGVGDLLVGVGEAVVVVRWLVVDGLDGLDGLDGWG